MNLHYLTYIHKYFYLFRKIFGKFYWKTDEFTSVQIVGVKTIEYPEDVSRDVKTDTAFGLAEAYLYGVGVVTTKLFLQCEALALQYD